MAKIEEEPYPWPTPWYDQDPKITWQEGKKEEDAAMAKLQRANDVAVQTGRLKGCTLKWQRGDGWALYVVTKERPLTLAWVPFGDCWQVEYPLIKGLDTADVREMVENQRRIEELFGSSKLEMEK